MLTTIVNSDGSTPRTAGSKMIVLREALKTDARYIGMIGSKRKRDFIYKSLIMEGFTIDDLNRVYSPIGLSIHSETPQEIAVSIVAELISVRRC